MSEETAEYQVKDKSGKINDNTRNEFASYGLDILKRSVLLVLYSARNYGPLQLTAIREQLGIPKVDENSDARDNSLVYGILTHLQNDGYVEYLRSPGWRITEEGIQAIEGST